MSLIRITLKPGKEQSILRFHPWIFSGAINQISGEPAEGDLVEVVDSRGNFLAIGHYQPSSISVRIVSFVKQDINSHFWKAKLLQALNLRKSLGIYLTDSTNIFRLVHGEGDGLPGLIIDIYGKTAVMQAHSYGMYTLRELFAQLVLEIMDGKVTSVYDKSSGTISYKSPVSAENGYIAGTPEDCELMENGNKFMVSWVDGQKTGFFIDQRENRQLLSRYCRDAKVLNAFCYTGGFSVYAARSGAKSVISIDSSEKAIDLTEKNMEINFGKNPSYRAINADVFDFLKDDKETYDVIVLDPPAFAKHKPAIKNALQAYKRLNAAAFRKLNPGGILFTFSCSQVVTREDFRNAVFSGAIIANRGVRILHQLTQPADHPINIYHPEGEYLKGLVLYAE
jgi:23S rRNA (cytosine1962-C5)-methyltransferase